MKVSFKEQFLEDLFANPIEELGKQKFSKAVIRHYRKKIRILAYADNLGDVAKLAGMNLEKLHGNKYKECYSVRINDQYRIIFKKIENEIIEILIVELSKHYE
jgi:plasmid maintenance system killer protein